jgi:hypothetical protein
VTLTSSPLGAVDRKTRRDTDVAPRSLSRGSVAVAHWTAWVFLKPNCGSCHSLPHEDLSAQSGRVPWMARTRDAHRAHEANFHRTRRRANPRAERTYFGHCSPEQRASAYRAGEDPRRTPRDSARGMHVSGVAEATRQEEDEHHPICVNKASWESRQAHDPDAPRDRVVVSTTGAHAAPSEGAAPTQPPQAIEALPAVAPPPAGAALRGGAVERETGKQPRQPHLSRPYASVRPGPASVAGITTPCVSFVASGTVSTRF